MIDLPGIPDRITSRLSVRPNGCWTWEGAHSKNTGYACVWWDGSQRSLHRVLYRQLRGEIPEGLVLDHVVCEDKTCPNPWHVEPETNVANMLRSASAPATINKAKTHCIHGHSLADAYPKSNGGRKCRTCEQKSARERQRRKHGYNPRKGYE
jgi:hypothetical protein